MPTANDYPKNLSLANQVTDLIVGENPVLVRATVLAQVITFLDATVGLYMTPTWGQPA